MSTIDWTSFTIRIPVRATMKGLYAAWTRASNLEDWFLRKASYTGADKKAVRRTAAIAKGCTFAWEWYNYDGVEKGIVRQANGKDHVQFTFAGSLVDVRLKQVGKDVIVELVQSAIPTDPASKKNVRLGCHVGWTFWLANLKSVYEGGVNLRNTNEELTGMVNN
ncbi:MAG: SRPBCC domain-containing protein [Flavobacteriales bacterium]